MELIFKKEVENGVTLKGESKYAGVLISSNTNHVLTTAKYILDDSQYVREYSNNDMGLRQSTINEYVLEQLKNIEDLDINSISDEDIVELFENK